MRITRESQSLLLQLLDPSNRADPYPVYDQIREHGPLQLPDRQPDGVLVVRRLRRGAAPPVVGERPAEVDRGAARDRRRAPRRGRSARRASCSSIRPTTPGCASWSARRSCRRWSRHSNPTSPRWSTGCSTRSQRAGTFDVIADLAYPLPVAVICRLLGVPIEDEPEFSRASALLAQALDPFITFTGEARDEFRRDRMQAGLWLRGLPARPDRAAPRASPART